MNVLVPYMLNANQWNWGLKTAFFYTGIGAPLPLRLGSSSRNPQGESIPSVHRVCH